MLNKGKTIIETNQGNTRQIRGTQSKTRDQGKLGKIKANQGESRQIRANQGKLGGIKADQGKSGQIWRNQGRSGEIKTHQEKSGQIKRLRQITDQVRSIEDEVDLSCYKMKLHVHEINTLIPGGVYSDHLACGYP